VAFKTQPGDTFQVIAPKAPGGQERYMLADGRIVALGRVVGAVRPPSLAFKRYYQGMTSAQPLPATWDHLKDKARPSLNEMLGNDQAGDCVIVGKMHADGTKSANDPDSGGIIVATTQEALSQYQTVCGHLGRDAGCIPTEVLNWQKSKGLVMGGRNVKIDGYVAVDNRDRNEVKTACILFGGLDVSFMVDASFLNNVREGAIWKRPTSPRIVGGHNVYLTGFTPIGVRLSTWAVTVIAEWDCFEDTRLWDEIYAVLGESWYGKDQIAANGFPVLRLREDLSKLDDSVLPDWEPPAPPPGPGPGPIPPAPPGPTPPGPNPPIPPAPPGPLVAESISGGLRINGKQISVAGSFAAGATVGTVTGTCSRPGGNVKEDLEALRPSAEMFATFLSAMFPGAPIPWVVVFFGILGIVTAWQSGDIFGAIQLFLKLLADLGLIPPAKVVPE
jgi:hypothetical protein